ncbi:MAG TPA: Gfo/Idh/MocA family oxidoreductase [Acidobacteriota bacterium]|nr:Gfo/Idh/MocA family oxidoreductase [Acidobacteriota bacterium]HRR27402.1 Gfo/Idh/MocA family oxidoreductase [Acidobacteriota bacterium]HRR55609.1 Gfo/Idh/MocA family oxidoreductase [Acidobacteriota bacterium]HRV07720.1 Gfo/Idh/MocA family oxidoreductase [Acidobacteriota bacterium]
MNRRSFIHGMGATASGLVAASSKGAAQRMKNDEITMAVIGIHGQGRSHFQDFCSIPGVRIKTVCDVDERLYPEVAKMAEQRTGKTIRLEPDVRRELEDPEIDAISIATPNHWHSLMTIWACQAGKHVYVEKPVSHNVWEGRRVVEAADRYGRVVQTGTQSRSDPGIQGAVRLLHEGVIGDVYMAKGVCYKPRNDIGIKPPTEPPEGLHFDLWLGPAKRRPFSENLVHYNWHWFWDFGNGDIGNQGVHQMDIARWGLNKRTHPRYIHSVGGHFAYKSDQETPNTLLSTFEWDDGKILQFEVRGLFTNAEDDILIGNLFYGTEGWMHVADDGYKVYLGRGNEPGPSSGEQSAKTGRELHRANFIEAVRAGNPAALNSDIPEGHLSSALCHLANISYRLGRRLEFDSHVEKFVADGQADSYLTRDYRYPFVVPATF